MRGIAARAFNPLLDAIGTGLARITTTDIASSYRYGEGEKVGEIYVTVVRKSSKRPKSIGKDTESKLGISHVNDD